jgi:UDP-2,3-diacylglucosamine hydrolase
MPQAVPMTTEPSTAFDTSVLKAPDHWREIDFISDLHLQDDEPATFLAWQSFMQNTPAEAVFILGDLFEVWAGDDVIESRSVGIQNNDTLPFKDEISFEKRCVEVLKIASQRLDIFIIHGNRDFLLSHDFEKASGATLLNDPTRLQFAGEDWLLSHGDSLCLDDTDYLAFKAQVRSAKWKQQFLAKPLHERQSIARLLRERSELRKKSGLAYADIDEQEAIKWLSDHHAHTLIHGHTHKPADHLLITSAGGANQTTPLLRMVLSDWDASATPPRTEILRLGVNHPPRRIKA